MAKNKLAQLAGITSRPAALPANEEMQYKAREALHVIHKAEECRRDKELMKHVKKLAKSQMKAITK